MNGLLLAVDIGNSAVKLALFDCEKCVSSWTQPYYDYRPQKQVRSQLKDVVKLAKRCKSRIRTAAICSVVPKRTAIWTKGLCERLCIRPYIISSETDFGLRILPDPASAVGRDRLVAAAAAYEKYGGPVIVVDIGTATTVDAVSGDGTFLGGAIAPGPATAVQALFDAGSQLPDVPLAPPERAIGRNTVEAMQSGIMVGYAGLLDGLVNRIRSELGESAKVVVTGGFSEHFTRPGMATVFDVRDPDLMLDGIRRVWERNRSK